MAKRIPREKYLSKVNEKALKDFHESNKKAKAKDLKRDEKHQAKRKKYIDAYYKSLEKETISQEEEEKEEEEKEEVENK